MNLRKARSYTIIYLILSSEFKPLIASTTSGAVARKILKQHFELTTTDCVIQQLDDFFSVRYVSGENLRLFLCKVKQGTERLYEVGHTLQSLSGIR